MGKIRNRDHKMGEFLVSRLVAKQLSLKMTHGMAQSYERIGMKSSAADRQKNQRIKQPKIVVINQSDTYKNKS